MKKILIAAVVLAAIYIGYKAYTYFSSASTITIDIVSADIEKGTVRVSFTNVGSSRIRVSSVTNDIFLNGNKLASANDVNGFDLKPKETTLNDFKINVNILSGISGIMGAIASKGAKKEIKVVTVVNVKGLIITKEKTF